MHFDLIYVCKNCTVLHGSMHITGRLRTSPPRFRRLFRPKYESNSCGDAVCSQAIIYGSGLQRTEMSRALSLKKLKVETILVQTDVCLSLHARYHSCMLSHNLPGIAATPSLASLVSARRSPPSPHNQHTSASGHVIFCNVLIRYYTIVCI